MNWQDVCADPNLQNLPYKIETNQWGQIVMTPSRAKHGALQFRIGVLLLEFVRRGGEVVTECAVKTSAGTKVADVAWISMERWEQVKEELDVSIAPEICVEVLSFGNSTEEMEQKRNLYFEANAEEVWICSADGSIRFYDRTGELGDSMLAPNFPTKITVS